MKTNKASIIIAGDIYPHGPCAHDLSLGKPQHVFHDVLPVLKAADYVVANLETPVTEKKKPISKDGANLKVKPQTLKGLKKAGIKSFGLANNHILDFGDDGLKDTLKYLDQNDFSFFGAGSTSTAAEQPLIVNSNGVSIGFIGVAEHEFSIASHSSYGANGLNIPNNARQINCLKQNVDHVIVLYHGGKEHYPYPTPNQQNLLHYFVEQGADVVIAQHSHIIGAYEWYRNGFILYGQGNFLFEKLSRNYDTWFKGVLVKLNFSRDAFDLELIPFEQSNGFVGVRLIKGEQKADLLTHIDMMSEHIKNAEKVKQLWLDHCKKNVALFQSRLFGHNKYLRFLNKKLRFADWLYPKWKKNMIRNVVECETHREGLETLWQDKNLDL